MPQMVAATPADIRRDRHIGDFTQWEGRGAYETAFQRVLGVLQSDGSR